MSFAKLALHPNLLKGIEACGYTEPTPVQASAIPAILARKDIIASAQTGSGKTAAFILPALNYLAQKQNVTGAPRRTSVLVLTPTRELADQILKAATQYGKFMRFSVASIIGGVPYGRQLASLSPAPDIIVATPGRLIDYMQNKKVNLSAVEMLVLDEADRMLDMGFQEPVEYIIKATPATRQTSLFSATFDSRIANLSRNFLTDPVQLRIPKQDTQKANIEQRVYMAQDVQHKAKLLSELLASENIFKAIIFSATKHGCDKLAQQLCQQGHSASAIHGDLRQNQRTAVLEKLRKDKIQFLVATDVAARGIDVAGITHVFNFDFPTFAEDYVHRIGRTGRAGKSGIAISLVLPKDRQHVKRVERYTGQNFSVIRDKTAVGASGENDRSQDRKANAGHCNNYAEFRANDGRGQNRNKPAGRSNCNNSNAFGNNSRGQSRYASSGKAYNADTFGNSNRDQSRQASAGRFSNGNANVRGENDWGQGRSAAGRSGSGNIDTRHGNNHRSNKNPDRNYSDRNNNAGRNYAGKNSFGRSAAGRNSGKNNNKDKSAFF